MRKSCSLAAAMVLLFVYVMQGQVLKEHRYPKQRSFEDSAHVFWTVYPNPFSPATVKDTNRVIVHGDLTFFCELSDTVELALVADNDSIVISRTLIASKPPHFSVGYWVAGPHVRTRSLPVNYFKALSDGYLRPLLIVAGRYKSLREVGIPVRKGWYYWIDNNKSGKR